MSSCFLSDLHLGRHHPEAVTAFHHFLDHQAPRFQQIYILGDLFDQWLGDDLSCDEHSAEISALRRVVERGSTLLIQHGNRDFALGREFARRTGATLLPDPMVIDLDGRKAMVSHGDIFCSDDLRYQRYRRLIRHPLLLGMLLRLPPALRRRLGQRLRQQSDHQKQTKRAAIMDVTQRTVETMMRRAGVQLLIHGHTHRPATHHFTLDGKAAERWVLGAWQGDPRHHLLIFEERALLWQPT